jgi:uncharacterized protein (DUF2147 family)
MKKMLATLVVMFLLMGGIFANSPVGLWKTIDDETGEEKSHVLVWEKNGVLYAKINKLLLKEDQGKNCDKCPGDKYNKPVLGMEVMWGVSAKPDSKGQYGGGKIMDPKNGKTYSCYLQIINPKELKVRGYVGGMKALGRSQTWYKID